MMKQITLKLKLMEEESEKNKAEMTKINIRNEALAKQAEIKKQEPPPLPYSNTMMPYGKSNLKKDDFSDSSNSSSVDAITEAAV